MRSTELGELVAFVSIVQQGNFRRAATSLNIKPSTLSHSMRALEERLGIRLLNRTTRKLSLTEAGQVLFDQVAPALGNIENAVETLNRFRTTPAGTVRSICRAFIVAQAESFSTTLSRYQTGNCCGKPLYRYCWWCRPSCLGQLLL